ncbi:MAG: ribonuclease J [Erysipelothrix sp.]|nr:ribonuclease J [Erysipelothrix sp.]
MNEIKIFSLGGQDEDGKNLYVIEINNDIFIIDSGSKDAESGQLGVEKIVADTSYLAKNKKRIKALFITHAHDDAFGGLTHLLQDVNVPIYTTAFPATLIRQTLKDKGIKNVEIHEIERSQIFKIAKTEIRTFKVTNSVPDSFGIAIRTKYGNIIYTNEFIVDYDIGLHAFASDISEIAEIGKEKVFALLSESTGANTLGYTAPSHKISHVLETHIDEAKGRIIITSYAQNIYRVIELAELCNRTGRKLFFKDKKMLDTMSLLKKLDYYHLPANVVATLEDLEKPNTIVLVTGDGSEVFKKMFAITAGEDERLTLNSDDTVIIASPSVPGVEIEAMALENELYKDDHKVITIKKDKLSSMHASQEDLKMLLYLFKPRFYIPVKGEYRHLAANADLAMSVGNIGADRIIILDNGQIATFVDGKLKNASEMISAEDIMVDGTDSLEEGSLVLKDRETLSTDGVIIIGILLDYKTKKIIGGPDVQTRGLLYVRDSSHVLKAVSDIMVEAVENAVKENKYTNSDVRSEVRMRAGKYVMKETGKRPMILPAIVEVN